MLRLVKRRPAAVAACPCCGHPVLPPNTLACLGQDRRRRVFEAIYLAGAAGIEVGPLIEQAWSDDPNGGPDSGRHVVYVHVHNINRALTAADKGLLVVSDGRRYRVITQGASA